VSSSTTFKLLDQQFGETRVPANPADRPRPPNKISQASRRPLGWLKTKNLDALAVEKKTASELAEIVATRIGISAAAIKVMPDPVYGWRAMVIGPRATVSKYQPQADRIRDELCTQYELER